MPTPPEFKTFSFAPQTWFGRVVAAAAALVLLVLAVFFFTLFLAAFTVIAIIVIARLMWLQRKFRRKAAEEFIEAEYTVEVNEPERKVRATITRNRPGSRGANPNEDSKS